MFRYFARLHEKYQLPVYPIVIFSYDAPKRLAAKRYEVSFGRFSVLDFQYRVVQLNRLNWRHFLQRPNPVASALMVKMKIGPADRPWVKLECLRMILKLKLDKAKSALIWKFMSSYLRLTAAEDVVYNEGMATLTPKQQETALDLSNEWTEKGARETLLYLLQHRFGKVPAALTRRISRLSEPVIREMVVAVLDFKDIEDAGVWITESKARR